MKFLLNDKYLKRAGLDYWDKLDLKIHDSWAAFLKKYEKANKYYFSTKPQKVYTDISFCDGDFLIFGPETRGLPESILHEYWENSYTIPITKEIRSINLSNSVAIVLYEGD